MTQGAFEKVQEQIPGLVAKMVTEMKEYYGSQALFGFEADIVEHVIHRWPSGVIIEEATYFTTGGALLRHVKKAKTMPDCTISVYDDRVEIVRTLKNGDRYEATYTPCKE